jgi:hypothetical protein
MLTYRPIQNNLEFAETVWQFEESLPEWWREHNHAWTPDYESYLKFWKEDCREIYGLFRGDTLLSCIYIEFLTDISTNVHISVISKDVSENDLVRFFISVKQHKINEGVRYIEGWIAARNKRMLELGEAAGFRPTGLKMDYGQSRGKSLRWIQVRAEFTWPVAGDVACPRTQGGLDIYQELAQDSDHNLMRWQIWSEM